MPALKEVCAERGADPDAVEAGRRALAAASESE
jgi:hypothetical protein